jgi:hypothetical protein
MLERDSKMQDFALSYIVWRILYRLRAFFEHWYVHAYIISVHAFLHILERLDRVFAFRAMFRHFSEPLFGDRSVVGYIIGFLFRLVRIAGGGITYFILGLIALALFIIWALIPVYIVFRIIF